MKTIKTLLGMGLVAGAMMLATPAKADAALIAYICDTQTCTGTQGVNWQAAIDQGAGDLNPGVLGSAILVFPTGGMEVIVNTSISYPLSGTPASPSPDLGWQVTNSAGTPGGTVWLYLVHDGFTGLVPLNGVNDGNEPPSGATVETILCTVGGSATGTPLAVNGTNCNFVTAVPTGLGSFSSPISRAAASASPYTIIMGVKVTLTGGGTVASGDYKIVPEPGALALFGIGLLGVGYIARRRRQ